MSSYLRQKYQAGRYILQKEGLLPFVVEGIHFLRRCIFVYERDYMYEMPLNEQMKFEAVPKIQNFVFEIVPTNQRLDGLVAQGFDFGIHGIRAREKLDKGALMFCIFVEKKLACVHWAATTQEAMNVQIKIPYKVDFSNSEAYLGWVETNPQYRRLGLSMYVILEKLKLLKTMGKTTGKCIAEQGNLASHKFTIKAGGRVYGEGCYLKILWWKSWKERPISREESYTQPAERAAVR
jgi:hypothetical protein